MAEEHFLKPVSGDRKIFIIKAFSITHEAQNSLLKTLEDPVPGTGFILLIPCADRLLPTLRSRFFVIKRQRGGADER
jgi:DNA polymerase III subunit delta'